MSKEWGSGRASRLLVSACAVGAFLVLAPSALAATFTVNDTGDGTDAAAGDGTCDTVAGAPVVCTLRAAIEETNGNANSPTVDTINFDNSAGEFDGVDANARITPGSDLPSLAEGVTVVGGDCDPGAAAQPCVAVNSPNVTSVVFNFTATDPGSSIQGIAIHGNNMADAINDDTNGLIVRNSWFGLQLDSTTDQMEEGIVIEGAGAQIGGASSSVRNVFGDSVTNHIRIRGTDNNTIEGNFFGTKADGSTVGLGLTTQRAIRVDKVAGDTPTGTIIGGPDTGAASTCDSGCNLIANVTAAAIDLTGSSADGPAGSTTVAGNHFGLSVNGGAQVGSVGSAAVLVGAADDVTIGGSTTAARNYFAEFTANAVSSVISEALNLAVQNNFVGLNAAGTARIGDGATIDATVATGVTVADNRVARTTGLNAAVQVGGGSSVTGNVIGIGTGGQNVGGGDSGIVPQETGGSTIGGTDPGEPNVIGNASTGITPNSDGNVVIGNRIGTNLAETQSHPIANTGIVINGTDSNVIGGDTAASENVIENVGDQNPSAAIRVIGDGSDFNAVLRNRGSSSSAPSTPFIDLTDNFGFGVQALGANEAIPAPTIDAGPTSEAVSGSGAEFGATVRVYRTLTGDGSGTEDIVAFVGFDVADVSGDWSVACPEEDCAAEMPGSGQVTANQTDTAGNSSELATAEAYTAVPPNTTITSGPAQGSTTADTTPTFGFSSNEAGSTFQCKVDGGAFSACSNPRTLGSLSDGQHTFQVRAVDTGGNQDATAASRTFTVDVPAPPPDTNAPETTITKAPKAKLKAKKKTAKATYEFSSDESGSTFECSLDGDAFAACTSPVTEKVKKGKHTFEVRATDAAGNVDSSPAEDAFKVKK